jgi:hypothetical protein
MRLVVLALLSSLACAQVPGTKLITPVTILKKADNSAGGTLGIQGPTNQLNAGQDYINSLVSNTAGRTIWRLGQSSSRGFLSLSNGTGSGGFDSNGAQIYAEAGASTGLLEVMTQIDVGFTDPRAYIRAGQFFTTDGAAAIINNIDTTGINTTVQVFVGSSGAAAQLTNTVFTLYAADGSTPQVRANNSAGVSTGGMLRTFDFSGNVVNTINHLGLTSTVGVAVGTTGAFSQLTNTVFTLTAADGITPQVRMNNSAGASTGGMIRTYDISGNVVNTFNHLGLKSSTLAGGGTVCLQADNNGLIASAGAACGSGSGLPVVDTTAIVSGSVDATKLLRFEVDGFTTATTRVLTPQNASYTLAGTDIAQTFSANQTLAADVLMSADNSWNVGTSTNRVAVIEATSINVRSASAGNRRWTISGGTLQGIDGGGVSVFSVSSLTGAITAANVAGGGTQCLNADNSGNITGTGSGCGSGSGFSASAWTSYTPSTTNLSSVSSTGGHNQYGKSAFFRVQVTGTSNGSTPTISLPFTAATNDQTFACTVALSGATVPCSVVVSSSTMTVKIYDNTAFGSGSTYTFIIQGAMETT